MRKAVNGDTLRYKRKDGTLKEFVVASRVPGAFVDLVGEMHTYEDAPFIFSDGELVILTIPREDVVPTEKHDPVNHPSHYTSHPSGIECITITQHHDFCVGNAIKYMWRAGLKDPSPEKEIEDIEKAIWYLKQKIHLLSSELPHSRG